MAISARPAARPLLSRQARNIASLIGRLTVHHGNPHRFHEDRDALQREADDLARNLERDGL